MQQPAAGVRCALTGMLLSIIDELISGLTKYTLKKYEVSALEMKMVWI
jgi:hypothetical protein